MTRSDQLSGETSSRGQNRTALLVAGPRSTFHAQQRGQQGSSPATSNEALPLDYADRLIAAARSARIPVLSTDREGPAPAGQTEEQPFHLDPELNRNLRAQGIQRVVVVAQSSSPATLHLISQLLDLCYDVALVGAPGIQHDMVAEDACLAEVVDYLAANDKLWRADEMIEYIQLYSVIGST